MTHSNLGAPLELKFLAETGVFEGYASVFNVVDSVNDKIAPGSFRESLAAFRASGRLPPLLWQHNAAEPIGVWREMYEDAHGLFVKGALFIDDIPLAKEAHRLLRENVVTGLSIGYRTKESHRDQKSGARVLTRLDLLEVSLVTFPANEHARVSGVKSSVAVEKLKNLMLLAAAEMKTAAVRSLAADRLITSMKKATAENLIKAGFSPAQPRAPRGASDGGQWSGGGSGGGRGGSGSSPKPVKNPDIKPGTGKFSDRQPVTLPTYRNIGRRLRSPNPNPVASKHPVHLSSSPDGVDFVVGREGFRRHQYDDDAAYPTIGYGHKLGKDEIYPAGIADDEALRLLDDDLRSAEAAVRDNVEVPLNQPQFDALTSFIYNVGAGKFRDSTLLQLLNQGDHNGAADEFLKWNKITDPKTRTKRPDSGLTNRRKMERNLFIEGIYR